ncbi:MAG TPA: ABC transporter ATP-binding protein [Firmicutes bacterium]|nr:ABC transporter ATP-binding protein [Bacillota bacterium]
MDRLLEIKGLKVNFQTYLGMVQAVDGVDLDIRPGETVGLVGESGSGKSVTALSVLRLIAEPPGRVSGQVLFRGEDLLSKTPREMRSIRGSAISMIFQEPMSSFNPAFRIGDQMCEVIMLHQKVGRAAAEKRAREMLAEVKMPDPQSVMRKYPFEMSGGMLQRAMIAMELSCRPALLIADEPTTALDVTVQAQILRLMKEMVAKLGTSVLLISHDLGVVAQTCDRVAVMYAGRLVESAPVAELFTNPRHPYTRGLLACFPDPERPEQELRAIEGVVPSLIAPPGGCRFHPRCSVPLERCRRERPEATYLGEGHVVYCHRAGEVDSVAS